MINAMFNGRSTLSSKLRFGKEAVYQRNAFFISASLIPPRESVGAEPPATATAIRVLLLGHAYFPGRDGTGRDDS